MGGQRFLQTLLLTMQTLRVISTFVSFQAQKWWLMRSLLAQAFCTLILSEFTLDGRSSLNPLVPPNQSRDNPGTLSGLTSPILWARSFSTQLRAKLNRICNISTSHSFLTASENSKQCNQNLSPQKISCPANTHAENQSQWCQRSLLRQCRSALMINWHRWLTKCTDKFWGYLVAIKCWSCS